jgi:WD40 repeat protein
MICRVLSRCLAAIIPILVACGNGSAALPSASARLQASDAWALMDQLAHSGRVTDLHEVADRGWMYSSGEDGHLKVWRIVDGLEIADFDLGLGNAITAFAVNPRKSSEVAVAVAGARGSIGQIVVFDVARAHEERRWSAAAHSMSMSPDGTFLAGKSFDQIQVWNFQTGQLFVGLRGSDDDTSRVQFTATGTLVFRSAAGIDFVDLSSGALLKRIEAQEPQDFVVLEEAHRLMEVGPKSYHEWDLEKKIPIATVDVPVSIRQLAVDPRTHDTYLLPLTGFMLGDVKGPLFRVDGTTHALSGLMGGDPRNVMTSTYASSGSLFVGNSIGRLRHWRFEEAKLKSLPELGVSLPQVTALDVSADRRFLAAGDSGGAVDIWDSATGAERTFDPFNSRPAPPKPHYGTAGTQGVEQTFVVGGRLPTPSVKAVHFLQDRDELSVVYSNGNVRLLDASTLHVMVSESATDNYPIFVEQTTDGLLYVIGNSTIDRWDLSTSPTKRLPAIARPPEARTSLRFALLGSVLAFANNQGILLFTPETGLSTQLALASPFCIAAASTELIAVMPQQVLAVSPHGGPPRSLGSWPNDLYPLTCTVAGKTLFVAGADGRLATVALDSKTANGSPSIQRVSSLASALTVSPSGGRVFLGGAHGAILVIDPATGNAIARLVNWGDAGWALIQGNAQFEAPPITWSKLVFARQSRPLVSLDQGLGFEQLFDPTLLRGVLADSKANAATVGPAVQAGSPPEVSFLEPSPTSVIESGSAQGGEWKINAGGGSSITIPSWQAGDPGQTIISRAQLPVGPLTVKAEARDTGGGIEACRLLRNHAVVDYFEKPAVEAGRALISTALPLIPGDNELGFYCFDRSNLRSSMASTRVSAVGQGASQRTAYVIGIGINTYAPESMKLNYAAADAELFIAELAKSLAGTGQYERIVPVPLLEQDATHDNIVATLKQLAAKAVTPEGRLTALLKDVHPAGPEDAVLVLFAGHGGMVANNYELLTQDYDGSPSRGILQDAELRALFSAINARDLLLVLDSCESGGVLGRPDERIGPFDSLSFAQMAYDKGMFVLVASQSTAAARELEEEKHGLLTHVLINEGLRKRLAFTDPQASWLSVRDFIDYAVRAVPEWQDKKRRELLSQGKAQIEGVVTVRRIKLQHEGQQIIQTPRDFIPPFGYNQLFSISGKPSP